jgi:hypothetical protein
MFIIKCYNQKMLLNYIMPQFHEEIMGIDGVCDDQFKKELNIKEYFVKKYSMVPDCIIFLWIFSKDIQDKIRKELPGTKIGLWTDDLHWFDKNTYETNKRCFINSDLLLSHYSNYKDFYNLNVSNKLLVFGHSCSEVFLKEKINYNSEDKIYMYGAINEHYRLRQDFVKNIEKYYPDKFIYKKHPGYNNPNSNKNTPIETANELYKYTFGFTAGIYPIFEIKENENSTFYLVGKFFEIMGAGCLLLCNDYGIKNRFNSLGFYDMKHYINVNNDNFDKIMKFIFDKTNRQKINEIRKNGYDLVKSKQLVKHTCDKVNKFIEQKLSNNLLNELDKIDIILENSKININDYNDIENITNKINSITSKIDLIKQNIDTKNKIINNNLKLKLLKKN